MASVKRITWVLVGPEPWFGHCTRCGQCEPKPELPTPLEAAITYMRYICEKHRHCQPREPKDVR